MLLLAAAPSAVLADDQCTVASILGCYEDSMKHRLLNISAAFCSNPTDGDMTQQKCAELCCAKSLTPSAIFGVEYGCQCWCGAAFAPGLEPTHWPELMLVTMGAWGRAVRHMNPPRQPVVFV